MTQKVFTVYMISLFLFASLVFHHSDARILQAVDKKSVGGKLMINHEKKMHDSFDLFDLMGSESCEDKDEECPKRRMVEEAHLDYIYTQQHKP